MLRTNEIARSEIITSLTTVTFLISTQVSIPFLSGFGTVTKVCTCVRNLTWFTRPFFLVRGWDLGMKLSTVSFGDSNMPFGSNMRMFCCDVFAKECLSTAMCKGCLQVTQVLPITAKSLTLFSKMHVHGCTLSWLCVMCVYLFLWLGTR